ncbi:MAG: hypothetical protein Kow00133_03000 [Amphiplicatus sp.]
MAQIGEQIGALFRLPAGGFRFGAQGGHVAGFRAAIQKQRGARAVSAQADCDFDPSQGFDRRRRVKDANEPSRRSPKRKRARESRAIFGAEQARELPPDKARARRPQDWSGAVGEAAQAPGAVDKRNARARSALPDRLLRAENGAAKALFQGCKSARQHERVNVLAIIINDPLTLAASLLTNLECGERRAGLADPARRLSEI